MSLFTVIEQVMGVGEVDGCPAITMHDCALQLTMQFSPVQDFVEGSMPVKSTLIKHW